MGNDLSALACCCSSDMPVQSGPGTAGLDMINPRHSQIGFLDAIALSEEAPPADDEEGWREWEPSSAEKKRNAQANNGLREQLLKAARLDDAPTVLQHVADGACMGDLGEALRLASHRGCASVVRELVAVGLVVNDGCPRTGFTPLQLASASGHLGPCELLLDAQADVHRSIGGASALSLARKMGHADVEEVLERHAMSLVLDGHKDGAGEGAAPTRRAHVLPRVSPTLSEAVLQTLPAAPPTPGSNSKPAAGLDPTSPASIMSSLGPEDRGDEGRLTPVVVQEPALGASPSSPAGEQRSEHEPSVDAASPTAKADVVQDEGSPSTAVAGQAL